MDSQHPIAGPDLADAHKIEDFAGSPQADSGYATLANSPEAEGTSARTPCTGSNNRVRNEEAVIVLSSLRETGHLQQFDESINRATADRFEDVRTRLAEPLYKYMLKSSEQQRIAIRLMVLGTSDADAKAWIVVLCHQKQVKRLRRFFGKDLARRLCQPAECNVPRFDVVAVPQCPRLSADKAAGTYRLTCYSNAPQGKATSCGTLIKIKRGGDFGIGTLGGILKVTYRNGQYNLYGMGAGHLVTGEGSSAINGFVTSQSSDSLDDSDWTSTEEDEEVTTATVSFTRLSMMETPCPVHEAVEQPSTENTKDQASEPWEPMGEVTSISRHHDWALISLGKNNDYKPNLLHDKRGILPFRSGDLLLPSTGTISSELPRNVFMSSGAQGIVAGSLSPVMSSISLASTAHFISVYTLTLIDRGKEMHLIRKWSASVY